MIALEGIRERFGKTAGVAKLSEVFQFQWTSPDSLEDKWLRWQRLMRQVNMTSLGDDARETLTIAGLEEAKERALERQCCVQVWISTCERRWTRAVSQPTPMEIGAVMSTCACCGKAGHEKARCRFRKGKCSNCGKTGHLRAMCRLRERSAGKSSPSSSSGKSSGQGGTSLGNTDKCYCCGHVGHRRPDCPRRNESCNVDIGATCVDLLVGTQVLGLSRWNPLSLRRREIQHVWALSVCDTAGFPLDALSVCDDSDFPSDESCNLLHMIMDSGVEEHVVSLADWKSLGEPVLKPAQVRLRSAIGDDMGVSGSFMLRGWCDNQIVELTVLVAT